MYLEAEEGTVAETDAAFNLLAYTFSTISCKTIEIRDNMMHAMLKINAIKSSPFGFLMFSMKGILGWT